VSLYAGALPSPQYQPADRRVAVVQSNYIPWKGYFDIIQAVDEFILFDDVQYTRRDWRNRNVIKTAQGPAWLTIPVNTKGQYLAAIKDITVSDPGWAARHWKALVASYGAAPYFKAYRELFQELYLDCRESHLSAINHRFLSAICRLLGIGTRLRWSMDLGPGHLQVDKTERLVALCLRAGATSYLSGPTAREYLREEPFAREGVELVWASYEGYRAYPQLHGAFEHNVSVLDLIFNTGPEAPRYMLGAR